MVRKRDSEQMEVFQKNPARRKNCITPAVYRKTSSWTGFK